MDRQKRYLKCFITLKQITTVETKFKFELDLPNYKTKSEVKKSNWC